MERSRHFFVRRKRWNNIGSRPRSSSANLFAPRFRARNDRGTRVGVFVKAIFRLPCGVPVWKKRANGHELFTNSGRSAVRCCHGFRAWGNTGTSEKKPCGAMPAVTPLPRADTSFGACTQLTCAAEVRAQTALSSVTEARGRTVRRDCAKPEVRPNESGSRRGSSLRAVRAKKRAQGSDGIALHSAQAQ